MMNKNASNYNRISSLEELEHEKARVRLLLQKQGKTIEKDWNQIYSFWSFVPKTASFFKNLFNNLPVSLSIFSFLTDIFRKKPKSKAKSTTLGLLGLLFDLFFRKRK